MFLAGIQSLTKDGLSVVTVSFFGDVEGFGTRSFKSKVLLRQAWMFLLRDLIGSMFVCIYFTGNPYPMTIEWVMACTGRDRAMVRPQGKGQRQHFHYPVNRWYVHSNIHHWAASCKNQNVVGNVSAITQFWIFFCSKFLKLTSVCMYVTGCT